MDDFDLIGISNEIPPAAFRWDLLNDDDHLEYSRDVARFVDWLVIRYRLQRQIPPCWWRHGAHVEELSALFIAWRGVMEIPDRPSSWIIWHEELARLLSRLRDHWNTGCTPDHHTDSPAPARTALADDWLGVSSAKAAFGCQVSCTRTDTRRVGAARSAVTEPSAVLQSSPPRPGRRGPGHPLDLSLALAEQVDASEAHADLGVPLQTEPAAADGPVAATPTARLRWLFVAPQRSSS